MGLEELLLWGRGIFYLWLIYALVSWFIRSGIESWRTKDENYRRDCVVIPVCAVILGAATLALAIGCLLGLIPWR
jgi:hypothetical protein